MFKFIFLVTAFCVLYARADITEKLAEGAVWQLLKQTIIANGHSSDYADCVIKVMKWTGVQDDVMGFDIVFSPEETVKKLENKMNFADAVCSAGGPIACIIGLILFVLAVCCCCRCLIKCCCCCSKQKPVIVQVIAGMPRSEVPYQRIPLETV